MTLVPPLLTRCRLLAPPPPATILFLQTSRITILQERGDVGERREKRGLNGTRRVVVGEWAKGGEFMALWRTHKKVPKSGWE